MKRGAVVIAATGSGYGGKPRPYVVIQAESYVPPTIILVGCSSPEDRPIGVRPRLPPTADNGLDKFSEVMVDIPVTVKREQIHQVVGELNEAEMAEVDGALMLILGLSS